VVISGIEILEKRTLAAYGSGAIASGIVDNVPSVLLLYFMTDQLKLDPVVSGSLIFIIRMLSLAIDPLVGVLWDKASASGRRPIVILAPGWIGLALSYAGLFAVPALVAPSAVYAAIALFVGLMTLSSSLISVTHVSMAAIGAFDEIMCERLVGARSVSLMIGFFIGGSIAPLIIDGFGGGISGYRINAILQSLVIAAVLFPLIRVSMQWPISVSSVSQGGSGFRAYRAPRMQALIIANMLQVLALAAIFGALPYLLAAQNGAIGLGVYSAVLIGAAACSVPIWQILAGRFGLATTFMAGGLAFCLGGALLGFGFNRFGNDAFYLSAILCGCGLGSIQFSAYALLAETLHGLFRMDAKIGTAGAIGIWSAVERATLSFGPLLIGLALKTNEARIGLAIPAVSIAAVSVMLSLFPLMYIFRKDRGAV
jgi:glycoside/pentoside/hexuronide:cation symporter, GPH family